MNKEEIMRNRDALIYDFDKVLPEHRILYEKLNGDLLILELHEKYQKVLEFIKQIVKDWECDPNHAQQLLKEIGELE
jgi:hypothetical protein